MKLCFSLCFSLLISRTMIYFHVYIIYDFPITYRNTSMLSQSECACLHKTVNTLVFCVKSNENIYPKGRALMQMYRVVPISKEGISTVLIAHLVTKCSGWSVSICFSVFACVNNCFIKLFLWKWLGQIQLNLIESFLTKIQTNWV